MSLSPLHVSRRASRFDLRTSESEFHHFLYIPVLLFINKPTWKIKSGIKEAFTIQVILYFLTHVIAEKYSNFSQVICNLFTNKSRNKIHFFTAIKLSCDENCTDIYHCPIEGIGKLRERKNYAHVSMGNLNEKGEIKRKRVKMRTSINRCIKSNGSDIILVLLKTPSICAIFVKAVHLHKHTRHKRIRVCDKR